MAKMIKKLLPDPDLEALIKRLNKAAENVPAIETTDGMDSSPDGLDSAPHLATTRWQLPAAEDEGRQWVTRLLATSRKAMASDLFLVSGTTPVIRVNGRLEPLGEQALSAQALAMLCAALVPIFRRRPLLETGTLDYAFNWPELGRFRMNVHRQRDCWSAAIRLFPEAVPELDALGLPESLGRFADLDHGLVLITGPTGSGKWTTLAALVREILTRRRVHLITIEDPTEFEHAHGDSVVEHIELGQDTPSFAQALRAALRQDPDVILIGEMRDPESISIAITAAETGHLVLSTLHTGDAPQTIHRIIDSYPPDQISTVRVQLSISLAGIISQQLLPRSDQRGRVPAVEILMATPAVRNLIRQGKIEMIRSQITLEQKAGMLDLDRSLAQLTRDGIVDESEAFLRARIPSEFQKLLGRG